MVRKSDKKRVLYITYDGLTDPLGQSQVLPYLIGLSRRGYGFHIISCEKPDRLSANRERIESICSDAGIEWTPLSYRSKPPVLSTLLDLYHLRKAVSSAHRNTPFSLIHVRSYIPALVALRMKRQLGVPFVFDMRGFWADERVDGGLWSLDNPVYQTIYRYFKRRETQFLQEAAHTVSLTAAGKNELESWNIPDGTCSPITVIPCCADLSHFEPGRVTHEHIQALRESLDISDWSHTIVYLGSIGTWYLLDDMMAFFKTFLSRYPKAGLLFVTREPAEVVFGAAERIGIDPSRIRVTPAGRSEVPAHLAVADAGLFFIAPKYSKKASSPVKQGEMMAMGLPVICNRGVGDTDYIVEKYHSGILVNTLDEAGYKEVADRWEELAALDPAAVRAGAEEFFALETGIDRYAGIYASVLSDQHEAL